MHTTCVGEVVRDDGRRRDERRVERSRYARFVTVQSQRSRVSPPQTPTAAQEGLMQTFSQSLNPGTCVPEVFAATAGDGGGRRGQVGSAERLTDQAC